MASDIPYRIALVLVAAVQGVVSRQYMKQAKAGGTVFQQRAEGLPLAVLVGSAFLAYCLAVLAYLVNPAWMAWAAVPLPAWLRWAGFPIMVLGAALHIWGMHHLGRNLTITISTREEHTLVTTGPYRLIRHPLYTAGMVESAGVVLLLANGAVAAAALAFWALIAWRTPMEEARLALSFGGVYRQYQARAGRFVPVLFHRRGAGADSETE